MNRPSENKSTPIKLDAETRQNEKINRRSLVRRGVKAAYVVPAVLAAIKASESPVIARSTPND